MRPPGPPSRERARPDRPGPLRPGMEARRPAPGLVRPARDEETDLVRIAGLAAVSALFARAPQRVERLFYEEGLRETVGPFCKALAQARRPYRMVSRAELDRIAGTTHHGGIVAVARPKAIPAFDPAAVLAARARLPLLLVLDGIGNSHNLGAIARTAAFFGLDRMVLSSHPKQCGPTDSAHRIAEGGLEHLTLYRAAPLGPALTAIGEGFLTVAAVAAGGESPDGLPKDRPVALVLGNEEEGPAAETVAACAARVTIPGSGRVESLNVSVAAGILIWALMRR
ncbi:MAG: RNA methyltransferase [Elioraea sp.]|nr:RNA methyltransferase [Elioraea sp.]